MSAFLDLEAKGGSSDEDKRPKKKPKRPQPPQARHWCFTLHGDVDHPPSTEVKDEKKLIRYMVYQPEICPESKRFHWQGYVEFSKPVRLTALKKMNATAHWEKRRGTRDEARAYCKKEDSRCEGEEPTEIGVWEAGGGGSRNDLRAMQEELKKGTTSNFFLLGCFFLSLTQFGIGTSMMTVAEQDPTAFFKYHRGFAVYKAMVDKDKARKMLYAKPAVTVYWGETGCGKTRKVMEEEPDIYWVPIKVQAGQWWDGYDGEEAILFDDFYGAVKQHDLLRLCDGYPCQLPVKGGHVQKAWKRVYFTSNQHPDSWWSGGLLPAMQRRITSVVKLGDPLYEFVRPVLNRVHVTADLDQLSQLGVLD